MTVTETEHIYVDYKNWDKDPRQKLPTIEKFEEFLKAFNARRGNDIPSDARFLLTPSVSWVNYVTKEDQEVFNFPIYVSSTSGGSHYAVDYIVVEKHAGNEWEQEDKWTFADMYYHVNIQSSRTHNSVCVKGEDGVTRRYVIGGHSLCTPIAGKGGKLTCKQQAMMYKAQLVGQNLGSPYQQDIRSICNAWTELVMCDTDGHRIPANAPIAQLLTKQALRNLRDLGVFRKAIQQITNGLTPNHVFIKSKDSASYYAVLQEDMQKMADEGKLSTIYPIITYEQAIDISLRLPKQPIDMLVAGLGSAGTGILDQIARSNYCSSFVLVDPDKIENKNLRNQWYTNGAIGSYKTDKSKVVLQSCVPRDIQRNIETYNTKFQEAPLHNYKAKYAIAGFDTIKARLEFLEAIMEKKIETKYLIDTRYDDLAASIYVIDVEDADQVRKYKAGLDEDYKAFLAREEERKLKENIQNFDQFWAYFAPDEDFNDCDEKHMLMGVYTQEEADRGEEHTFCPICTNIEECLCGDEQCKEHMRTVYEQYKDACKEIRRVDIPAPDESSCLRQNFIDIYKYASTFVFSAIREIEEGNAKPFTHVEAQTAKFPSHMVVGK